MENDLFPIGRVVKPHGVKGKIKVRYYGEDLHQFSHYPKVMLPDENGNVRTYEVLQSVPQPPLLILQLKGIETIEDAFLQWGGEHVGEKGQDVNLHPLSPTAPPSNEPSSLVSRDPHS